jgi:GNAT superfamily N-acetyltransferase
MNMPADTDDTDDTDDTEVGPEENAGLVLRIEERGSGPICRQILNTLPTWFGIPESVSDYVHAAEGNPTVVARLDGTDVGVLTLVVHSPYAAEIYVMGVRPELHRHGIGKAMLDEAEIWLGEHGIEYLQVKTLSPRHPDPGYLRTRAFYLASGFRPLQEFPDLWSPDQPALQLIKAVSRP